MSQPAAGHIRPSAEFSAARGRRVFRKLALIGMMAIASASALVLAQDDPDAPTTEITEGTGQLSGRPGPLPRDAFRSDPEVGIRYRSLFRDTRTPLRSDSQVGLDSPLTGAAETGIGYQGPVSNFRTGVNFRESIPGEGGGQAATSLDVMGFRLGYRLNGVHGFNLLSRGFEPEDADLKVGPLYFKLRALSASVLASDNVNATETNRESGAIAIARLSGSVVAQLTESLRIAAGGTLIWLPFKGKVGLTTSSGLFDLNLTSDTDNRIPAAQVSWDGKIGEWEYYVTDTFRIYAPLGGELFQSYIYDQTLFEGSSFNEIDQAGRYRYGYLGHQRPLDRDSRSSSRLTDFSLDARQYSNRIEAGAHRMYPGRLHVQLRAYREDLWYNQGQRGLPRFREGAAVLVDSQRENLRFKPYARYEITLSDGQDLPNQLAVVGLRGPITDQLIVDLYSGLFHQGDSGRNRFIAGMRLGHQAGPYTFESLFVGREVLDYYLTTEVVDRISYNIHQVLGPKIFADALASYNVHHALDDTDDERQSFRAGIRLTTLPGPRTSARLSYFYSHVWSDSTSFLFPADRGSDEESDKIRQEYTSHSVHLDLRYHFTDSFIGQLSYAYIDRESTFSGDTYYENLVLLSLTKFFY
ncbi:MAG: hypothetical protein ABMA13_04155 [Chthoniobacteraceae bacterium]